MGKKVDTRYGVRPLETTALILKEALIVLKNVNEFIVTGRNRRAILYWLRHDRTFENSHIYQDDYGHSHWVADSIDIAEWFHIEQARLLYVTLFSLYEERYWELLPVGDRGAVIFYANESEVLGVYKKETLRKLVLALSIGCRSTAWQVYNLVMELSSGH